ncbi:MAG TPA: tetratricopeptide repeat protein [Drouetiella sp.]
MRLDESNANAYLNRGWFFTLKRSPDRALENLDLAERYCKSPRTSAFIKSNRARAQTLLGDLQSALNLANEAIELLPLAEFFCTRAVCYFLMGDHEKALTDLKKSITLDPHELEAYWYKAKILRLRGDESHAMELEQKVVGFEHRFLF